MPSLPPRIGDDDDAASERNSTLNCETGWDAPLRNKIRSSGDLTSKLASLDHIGGQAVVLPHTAMVAAALFPMRARCMPPRKRGCVMRSLRDVSINFRCSRSKVSRDQILSHDLQNNAIPEFQNKRQSSRKVHSGTVRHNLEDTGALSWGVSGHRIRHSEHEQKSRADRADKALTKMHAVKRLSAEGDGDSSEVRLVASHSPKRPWHGDIDEGKCDIFPARLPRDRRLTSSACKQVGLLFSEDTVNLTGDHSEATSKGEERSASDRLERR